MTTPEANPEGQAHLLLDQLLEEVRQLTEIRYEVYLLKFAGGRGLLLAPAEVKAAAVIEAFSWLVGGVQHQSGRRTSSGVFSWNQPAVLQKVIVSLLRDKLPFTREGMEQLVPLVRRTGEEFESLMKVGVLPALEDFVAREGMPDSLYPAVEQLATRLGKQRREPELRALWLRTQALLERALLRQSGFALTTDEAWTNRLRTALQGMDPANRARWDALLTHAATASSSKPSKRWLQQAAPLVDAVGTDAFATLLSSVLRKVGKWGAAPKTWIWGHEFEGHRTEVHDTHCDLLRGLVWCSSLVPQEGVIAAVGAAADASFKKLPDIGPRAPKIGNACVWALSAIDDPAAVAELQRLMTQANHVSIRKQLDKALATIAARTP
jgi:hypothetical protein